MLWSPGFFMRGFRAAHGTYQQQHLLHAEQGWIASVCSDGYTMMRRHENRG
jgi:hypothetical protein